MKINLDGDPSMNQGNVKTDLELGSYPQLGGGAKDGNKFHLGSTSGMGDAKALIPDSVKARCGWFSIE